VGGTISIIPVRIRLFCALERINRRNRLAGRTVEGGMLFEWVRKAVCIPAQERRLRHPIWPEYVKCTLPRIMTHLVTDKRSTLQASFPVLARFL
jgi:hypothetical protein